MYSRPTGFRTRRILVGKGASCLTGVNIPQFSRDNVAVMSAGSAIGRTSLTLNFDMFADDGTPRAKGYLVVVAVDVSSLDKRPLPPELVDRLAPHAVLTPRA